MSDTAPETAPAGSGAPPAPARKPSLAALLTTCAVVNVGSIYLAQPLLPFIGDTLEAGTGAMSVVQGALQLAFGVGLVLFGILADTSDRRKLLTVMAGGLLAAAAMAAAAPTYAAFLVASLGMGAFAAVLPVLIATAAAAGDTRALVGILSGAPAGVVAGRTLAGLLGEIDWRLAFTLSAVAMATVLTLIRLRLAPQPPVGPRTAPWPALREMASLTRLPGNVLINLSNSVAFLGWSSVWTMLSFQLKDEPLGLSAFQIGLVGLVGLGGAITGQVGTRMQASLGESGAARTALVVTAVAGLALAVSGTTIWALVIALFVHNTAVWVVQAVNIPGAARRAGDGKQARGAALVYLTNFICTAIGAVLGAVVWESAGWAGIGVLAAGTAAVSLLLDLGGRAAWNRAVPVPATERSA